MSVHDRLRRMVDAVPVGATVALPREVLEKWLHEDPAEPAVTVEPVADPVESNDVKPTWRERLWSAPAETRIGINELCEALSRSKSWVYKQTKSQTVPYRKNEEGELVFLCGEIRDWLKRKEYIMVPPGEVL